MNRLMVLALAGMTLSASYVSGATAQGRGNGRGKAQARPEVYDRDCEVRYDRNGRVERDPRCDRDERADRNDRDDRADRNDRSDGRDDRNGRGRNDDWWENRRDRDDRWQVTRTGNGRGPAFCRSGAGHPVYGRQWCVSKGFGLGRDVRWDRVRWDDVYFRRNVGRTGYEIGRGGLIDVLGDVVYGRLDARRRYLGVGAPLTGRWQMEDGRSVLLVNAGGLPLAELVDSNRDRRVDLVLVNLGR